MDDWDRLWCSLNDNFSNDYEWANCDLSGGRAERLMKNAVNEERYYSTYRNGGVTLEENCPRSKMKRRQRRWDSGVIVLRFLVSSLTLLRSQWIIRFDYSIQCFVTWSYEQNKTTDTNSSLSPAAQTASPPCDGAETKDDKVCCVFPFTYKGESHKNCTTVDSYVPWCATALGRDEGAIQAWRFCT